MSYNGIGLKSAKGSSTSGHIQRSLANDQDTRKLQNFNARNNKNKKVQKNKPVPEKDAQLMKHLSKRDVELQVSELRDKLEDLQDDDPEITDEFIDSECDKLRKELLETMEAKQKYSALYTKRDDR